MKFNCNFIDWSTVVQRNITLHSFHRDYLPGNNSVRITTRRSSSGERPYQLKETKIHSWRNLDNYRIRMNFHLHHDDTTKHILWFWTDSVFTIGQSSSPSKWHASWVSHLPRLDEFKASAALKFFRSHNNFHIPCSFAFG